MRPAALAALAGAAGSVLALILAAVAGGPYLSADHVNGWIVVFAAALLLLLCTAPFLFEGLLRARRQGSVPSVPEGGERSTDNDAWGQSGQTPLRDERWEGAALAWGGLSLCILVVAVPVGLAESFAGDSLAGTAALIATIESGLVLGTLAVWLLSG
jgi:hypothetical protein